jgi:heterokaryon incompatibility protein (HET)
MQNVKLPTRLLDLNSLPSREVMVLKDSWRSIFASKLLRLVETDTGKYGQYIALSYCWGSVSAYKTTVNTKNDHMSGINFDCLPRTIQDTIVLTRYLGLQYLWIDCLCIVQDDREDWERESYRMGSVYQNSYLTIAASRAKDCSEGFLGKRVADSILRTKIEDGDGQSFWIYFKAIKLNAPGSAESAIVDPLIVSNPCLS